VHQTPKTKTKKPGQDEGKISALQRFSEKDYIRKWNSESDWFGRFLILILSA
jgi:hypothetical protein